MWSSTDHCDFIQQILVQNVAVLNAGVTELTDRIKFNLTASPAPLLSGPFLFQMVESLMGFIPK